MRYRLGKTSQERKETLSALTEIATKLPMYFKLNSEGEISTERRFIKRAQVLKEWSVYGKLLKIDRDEVLKNKEVRGWWFSFFNQPDHLEELCKAYSRFKESGIQPYLDKVRAENEAYLLYREKKGNSPEEQTILDSVSL